MQFAGFDHIDLRVADLDAERQLYNALMPALGLTEIVEHPDAREYYEPMEPGAARRFLGLNTDPAHRANAHAHLFCGNVSERRRPASRDRPPRGRACDGRLPRFPIRRRSTTPSSSRTASGNKLEIAYRRPHVVQAAQALDEAGAAE
jgi:hypothetical protein